MVFRWGATLGLSLGFVALATTSVEAKEVYRLEFLRASGAEKCPGEKALREIIVEKIGRDPFLDDATNVLWVTLRGEGDSLFAELIVKKGGSEEHSVAKHKNKKSRCERLLEDAAFSAVMIVDPLTSPDEPAAEETKTTDVLEKKPAPADRSTTQTCPEPLSDMIPAASLTTEPLPPPGPPPDNARFFLSAGVGGALQSTPGKALSLSLGGGARWSHASLGLETRLDFLGENTDLRVPVQGLHLMGLFLGCGHLPIFGRFGVDICPLVAVGWTRGEPSPNKSIQYEFSDANAFSFALGLRTGASFSLSRDWSLGLRVDTHYLPSPQPWNHDEQEIWRQPTLSAALQVAVIRMFDSPKPTGHPSETPPPENSSWASR